MSNNELLEKILFSLKKALPSLNDEEARRMAQAVLDYELDKKEKNVGDFSSYLERLSKKS